MAAPCKICYTSTMPGLQKALFAAGCFWGVQYYFDQVPGVAETTAGYTGGHTKNPTYDEVCTHLTGHAEAVCIAFDPNTVSYQLLVRHFFRMHDPTQADGQGNDIGDQYRSAIFYFNDLQKMIAESIRKELHPTYKKPIVTQITMAGPFYKAESYHQKFAQRTGIGACHVAYAPIANDKSATAPASGATMRTHSKNTPKRV
jgi:methionine-S-sulfoxide reductase